MLRFSEYTAEAWDSRGYRDNPIPTGKYNQDNIGGVVQRIENHLESGKRLRATEIDVPKMVNGGTLKATQDHLYKFGGGDPVFEDLKHPVLFKDSEGVHHIIDGHHRLARALEQKHGSTKVHIFKQ